MNETLHSVKEPLRKPILNTKRGKLSLLVEKSADTILTKGTKLKSTVRG